MVWIVNVEIGGKRQADSFLITAGDPGQRREITVGRPPAKADTKPDIVVPEKSVSKIHAVLRVEVDESPGGRPNRLILEGTYHAGLRRAGRGASPRPPPSLAHIA